MTHRAAGERAAVLSCLGSTQQQQTNKAFVNDVFSVLVNGQLSVVLPVKDVQMVLQIPVCGIMRSAVRQLRALELREDTQRARKKRKGKQRKKRSARKKKDIFLNVRHVVQSSIGVRLPTVEQFAVFCKTHDSKKEWCASTLT